MEKRLSQRQSGKLLAAAVASVGLAGFAASQANAGLVIDLRAAGGTGYAVSNGGKTVGISSVGVTILMNVFARISGSNATQLTGDIDGSSDGFIETFNDDTLQSVVGSFQSVGNVKGNMAPTAGPISTVGFTSTASPFNASGQTNGAAQDWDSDGDLDIGATGTDPTLLFAARAGGPTGAALSSDGVTTNKGYQQGGASFGPNTSSLINASTNEVRIGNIRFIVTALPAGESASVQFVPRAGADNSVAQWFEDGDSSGKFPGSSPGNFTVGAPISAALVPEPATIGLLGVASLGLLARRRNNKNA